ncbi:MAG: hypothetical protein ACK40X_04055 [Armatimonadota bacterium]
MNEQEIFRQPLKRKRPPQGARVLASMLVPGRPSPQAVVQEELIMEALARSGARSLEELVAKARTEQKIARQLRVQIIPRPTVEPPRRVEMIEREQARQVGREELPSSLQLAIRTLDRYLMSLQRPVVLTELRAEKRFWEHAIDRIDTLVARVKAVAQMLGVSLDVQAVRDALSRADATRRRALDRILTIEQSLEEIERKRREGEYVATVRLSSQSE